MQHLEVSGAVRHINIYIYVVRQLRVKTGHAMLRQSHMWIWQLDRWSGSSPTMHLESSLPCSQKSLKPDNSFLSYLHSVLIFFHLSMSSKWPESFSTKTYWDVTPCF